MAKFTKMTTLNEKEQQFAKERAAQAWAEIQDKFVGVALEPAILKIIEQAISFGMLHVKATDQSEPLSDDMDWAEEHTLLGRI